MGRESVTDGDKFVEGTLVAAPLKDAPPISKRQFNIMRQVLLNPRAVDAADKQRIVFHCAGLETVAMDVGYRVSGV